MEYTTFLPENLLKLKISVVHAVAIVLILVIVFLIFGFSQYRILTARKTPE